MKCASQNFIIVVFWLASSTIFQVSCSIPLLGIDYCRLFMLKRGYIMQVPTFSNF